MNAELQPETMTHDMLLPHACLTCGGAVSARFTPGSARGVCLACRRLSAMLVTRGEDGFTVVQVPGAMA